MTPHSRDTPAVTLPETTLPVTPVSNTSAQWSLAIRATVAVSRLRRSLTPKGSAHQQGLGETAQLEPEYHTQNGSSRENGEIYRLSSHNEEANQNVTDALDKTLENEDPEVEIVKLVRDELVKQLDAYGLVLVLLAGITFVAILQPPGSFAEGKLQKSLLVSLFMLLATLSFFLACTGLGAVMVGCAQLFRPFFHPKLAQITAVSESKRLLSDDNNLSTETLRRRGSRKWWHSGCWKIDSNKVAFDDIKLLADFCEENVYRVWRIRLYLGVSLVLCIAAYICGALAVMVKNHHERYLLIGAMVVGSVVVLFEIYMTTPYPVAKRHDGSFQRQFGGYTIKRKQSHPQ